MLTNSTGCHINTPKNLVIQPSKSQVSSLAFMDADGLWVHLDVNAINQLYKTASTLLAPPPTPVAEVNMNQKPSDANSPFDDHFKV
jgi:hypothetical protein